MEGTQHEPAENDCSAHPEALSFISFKSEGADCNGEDEKQSARKRTALDNRFHRTLRCTGLGPAAGRFAERYTLRVRVQAGELGSVRRLWGQGVGSRRE